MFSGVNWEIILRDFWGAILRPLVTPTVVEMQMPECEHLNPHLFEASEHAFYRTRKSVNRLASPAAVQWFPSGRSDDENPCSQPKCYIYVSQVRTPNLSNWRERAEAAFFKHRLRPPV